MIIRATTLSIVAINYHIYGISESINIPSFIYNTKISFNQPGSNMIHGISETLLESITLTYLTFSIVTYN